MDGGPPPPPHGSNGAGAGRAGGLPPGNYDIFVIPPHSAGSGFLYLPSLQTHRNSFIAGVVCTLAVVGVCAVVVPLVGSWLASLTQSGAPGMIVLVGAVGAAAWAFGKAQGDGFGMGGPGSGGSTGGFGFGFGSGSASPKGAAGTSGDRPRPFWQSAPGQDTSGSSWAKAREDTRKREEERRAKEQAEKTAKEAADRDRADKARARDREVREREARDKIAAERAKKEAAKKPTNYNKPTAQSWTGDDEHSYRPYDTAKSYVSESTASSYTYESQSTSKTSPPPSQRGPYATKDPGKIQIKGVFAFTDASAKPSAQMLAGAGGVTDGLVLRMTTEGLFVDDDVRGLPAREWDVKAWTLKLVEVGQVKTLLTKAHRRSPRGPARRARGRARCAQQKVRVSGAGRRGLEGGRGPGDAAAGQPGAQPGRVEHVCGRGAAGAWGGGFCVAVEQAAGGGEAATMASPLRRRTWPGNGPRHEEDNTPEQRRLEPTGRAHASRLYCTLIRA